MYRLSSAGENRFHLLKPTFHGVLTLELFDSPMRANETTSFAKPRLINCQVNIESMFSRSY